MPTSKEGVVWDWSLSEPDKNVLFIYRTDHRREVKIYLDEYNPVTESHRTTYLLVKERKFLNRLLSGIEE